jgi:hypothetical protein
VPGTPSHNLRLMVFVALTCVLVFEVGVLMAGFRNSLEGNGDFSAFYRTGVMVRAGELQRVYDPENQLSFDQKLFTSLHRYPPYYFYHPPFEALLLYPFAFVSYRAAFWIWSIGSFILLVISGQILSTQFSELRRAAGIPLTIPLLMFFPVVMVFLQGQDSALLLFLVTCAFVELNRGRDWSCGILLALALFKFQFIIPLAAMLAWRLSQKFVIAFVTTAAALFAASWFMVGSAGLASYWAMLVGGTPEMVSRMPNLRGVVESLGGPPALGVALAVVLAALCAIRVTQVKEGAFELAIIISLLVSHHGHVYDCLLLIIPIFYALEKAVAENKTWPSFWPALFFAMLPVYILLTRVHATWIFALTFLVLGVTITRPAASPNSVPVRAGEVAL